MVLAECEKRPATLAVAKRYHALSPWTGGASEMQKPQESGTAPRAALTTVKKLEEFIDCCKGMRGYRAACMALQYTLEGSASSRESETAMLLYLPLCHGGYGLPSLSLNREITVPEALRYL